MVGPQPTRAQLRCQPGTHHWRGGSARTDRVAQEHDLLCGLAQFLEELQGILTDQFGGDGAGGVAVAGVVVQQHRHAFLLRQVVPLLDALAVEGAQAAVANKDQDVGRWVPVSISPVPEAITCRWGGSTSGRHIGSRRQRWARPRREV